MSRTVLGIESSCDETAVAVVAEGGRVLSNVISTQIPVHSRYGGVVPELASRNHLLAFLPVLETALSASGVALREVDAIGVTVGPGLMGSLLVGMQTAKALALAANLPVIGVDHIEAHLLAVTLEPPASEPDCRAVQPPFVALVASGGHTATYDVDDQGQCTVLGHTLDDAAGEAFDKVGKLLGLPYPGGVSIDRLARSGDPGRWPLPRAMLDSRSLDFSFSGLKTAVRLHVESRFPDGVPELELPHLAASVQEAIVEVLVEKAVRAARRANRQTIVLAGGVAANSRLRARARSRFAEEGIDIALTPRAYCTDNAAMIAGLALRRWSLGLCEPSADLSFDAYANRLTGTPRAARGLLGKQRYRT